MWLPRSDAHRSTCRGTEERHDRDHAPVMALERTLPEHGRTAGGSKLHVRPIELHELSRSLLAVGLERSL